MNQPPRSYSREGPRELPPKLTNSLETEDEMMGVGQILLILGVPAVLLVVIVILIL